MDRSEKASSLLPSSGQYDLPVVQQDKSKSCYLGHRIPKIVKAVIVLAVAAAFLWQYNIRSTFPNVIDERKNGKSYYAAASADDFDWYALTPSEDLVWTSCFGDQKCARFSLPLDYLTPEGPKAHIAIRMIPATDKENYKGPVLINPGGPGGSGTDLVQRSGKKISQIIGPEFDIVGFDPRGTGASTPSAQCFDSPAQFEIWSLKDVKVLNATDDSIPIMRSRQKIIAERCQRALGGNGREDLDGTAEEWGPGRFMGTPSVATDMLRITEKMGFEKLQYWGFSYGSILGQYFTALYPDKVGRVIIDGVFDGENYRSTRWSSNLEDTDAVADSFFTFCHQAGPEKCPLYAPTVSEIRNRVHNIYERLSDEPVPIPFAENGPAVFTLKQAVVELFQATYKPSGTFTQLAEVMLAVERNNQTALANVSKQLSYKCNCERSLPWLVETEAFYAIACGDGDEISYNATQFKDRLEYLTQISHLAGPIWAGTYLRCTEWKIRSKWRYTGPLAAQNTSHPILIVSPRYDPVCPLRDAQVVHKRYAGSGLLVQNSYGHCSVSAPSVCTAKHLRSYFLNGTIPEDGTVCEVDELPFVGAVNVTVLSMEDQELLDALRSLGREVPNFGPL